MSYKFALAGNPNSGKTTLFNQLTGSTAHVGNWPGVTVERKEGKYKKAGESINIIDLPGIYSLSPYSPEEVIARNYIIDEHPDLIINIVDATNLERNLYLSTQILEIDCPMVIALNMMDVVDKQKDKIDINAIEKNLGVPVVPISASKNDGIAMLMKKAVETVKVKRTARSVLMDFDLGKYIGQIQEVLQKQNVKNALYYSIKFLENDTKAIEKLTQKDNAEIRKICEEAKTICDGGDCEGTIADYRYQYITKHISKLIKKIQKDTLTTSDKIDKVLTNRILGIPIFLAIMFLVFHITFSENFLTIEEMPSPGVWLQGLMEDGVGWVTDGIADALESANAADWAQGLVVDGILAGVGAVFSFLPQILLLFLFLSILEDSGYMARAAFIMDRLLRRFGLSGKSFMPMLMGFGCSVPAIIGTRTLENEKTRRLTIMLIPWMSCGAKLPIHLLIAAAFFPNNTDLVVFGMYLLGVVVAILMGIILKNTLFKGDVDPFIMELPTYHFPRLKSLLLHLWEKLKGFVIRAGTIILGSTIVIWFLANFGFDNGFGMVEANSAESILGVIGNGLRFIFVPLGFASGDDGWKAVVAILTGLIAKELVVSTMGQLYIPGLEEDAAEDSAAGTLLGTALASQISPLAAISFLAFNLLAVPCMAAVGAIRQEMNSTKWTFITIGIQIATAWIVSFLIYNIGSIFIH